MNWKVIFQLSLFGLAMGIATVFVIPSNIEPVFWLVIFVFSAYVIARKAPGKYFLHGLMVSIANSVWITAAHVLFYETYAASHGQEIIMFEGLPGNPRLWMLVFGPVIGVVSGIVLGLFAVVAARILAAREKPVST